MRNDQTKTADPGRQHQILKAYHSALTKESHNLRAHPNLLWQQLHNRLQWDDGPAAQMLESELMMHTAPGARPWFKTKMPYPESERVDRTLVGHTDLISCCRFSPDGRWIISASKDGTLKIWNASSGREIRTLSGHEGGVTRFAMSRDSKTLVSGSWDNTVKIWDPASGKCRMTLEGHENTISDIQLTPDGRLIASAGQDSGVWLWRTDTGELLEKVGLEETSPFSPYRSRISPDGVMLAFAAGGSLYIYDLEDAQMAYQLSIGIALDSGPFEFSPNGRYIACANKDRTVSIWDLYAMGEAGRVTTHRNDSLPQAAIGYATYVTEIHIVEMAFSPDSNFLITGTNIGGLATWNVPEQRGGFRMPKHTREISAIVFSPDGKFVVTGSEDATLKVLNPRTGMEIETFHGHSNEISYCAVSPDGEKILSGSYDGTLRLWNRPDKKVKGGTFKHKHQVSACAINAEHNIALSGGQDGVVASWELTDNQKQYAGEDHKGPVEACAISRDGRTLLSYGDDVTLRQWHRQFGAQQEAFKEADLSMLPGGSMGSRFAKSCLVTGNGKYAITEARTTLFVWNLQQHEKIQFIEHHCRTLPQQSCLLSPDDSCFVAVNEGTIAFYKFGEPEPFRTMPGLAPMALSPEGEAFLYRDPDKNQLRIDSLASTSKEALWLEGDNNSQTCKFSHGGDLVAACTDDGALTVWEAATGKQRFRVLAHQEYAQDPSTFSDIHASWNPTMNCAFTFDDQLILTIGIDQFMKAWDAETGELVTAFPMFSKGASFDVDHTQPIAILGDYGGSVFLVDIIQP